MRNTSPGAAAGLAVLLVLGTTTGCAVHVDMPEVPAHHPASPDAEAAPLPPPSPLLDSYRAVEPPPEMPAMGTQGHGMHDGHAMEGPGDEPAEPAEPAEPVEPESHEGHHEHPPRTGGAG
jgi:hypothetical protein